MAARSPRTQFANPFVVTLATLPACFSAPAPAPQGPEAIGEPTPAPQVTPSTNPPRPSPEPTETTPPPTPLVTAEARWTISKTPNGCMAYVDVQCPKPTTPGGPMPTCNPPPPMKATCPADWDGKTPLAIVKDAHGTDCYIEQPPCPYNARCKAPPKVACPTY